MGSLMPVASVSKIMVLDMGNDDLEEGITKTVSDLIGLTALVQT